MNRSNLLFACLLFGACTHAPDIEIRNPLVAHAVARNKIVKPHDYAEQLHGLPSGVMADEATLVSLDADHICFRVTLHELETLDLRSMKIRLTAPGHDALEQPEVSAALATAQTYRGIVTERVPTGSETFCASYSDGVCSRWSTRPTYSLERRPGPVMVYEARGTMCFANSRFATESTPQVALELKTATKVGGNFLAGELTIDAGKKTVFRWGLAGDGSLAKKDGA